MPIVVPSTISTPELEEFILNGLALNDNVNLKVLSVSWPPPRQRQDWIGAADSEAQVLTRNPLHENRRVTLRMEVVQQASMDSALDFIGDVEDQLAAASASSDEGVELVWSPAESTREVTFDVLAGEITDLPVDLENGWHVKAPQFTIELTCKPYWRGTETLTTPTSASTPFVTQEITGVTGDVPALGRLIITDTASQSRRHVEWGLEGPLTYNAATSLLIDSDSMVTTGFTGVGNTPTGAYDPNASGSSAVTGNALNSPTAIVGLGNLSHVGVFLVKARVRSDTTGGAVPTLKFRLTWRAADGPWTSNAWAAHTTGNATYQEVDLGTIRVPATVVGTQRWTGQIEAMTAAAAYESATVDYVELIPAGEGYGKARAAYAYRPGVIAGYDDFASTTAGGTLNARVAPSGGTWATSGATTDFAFSDDPLLLGEQVRRVTSSDSGRRFAILGSTNFTDTETSARVALYNTSGTTTYELGLILRWVDSSNYLAVIRKVTTVSGSSTYALVIEQVVAGAPTTLASVAFPAPGDVSFRTLRALAFASGRVIATHTSNGQVTTAEASSTALATGGTLATGKPGFLDRSTASAATRLYDDFTVATPAAEPIALYSGRNMQVRHDDVIRQDSTGTYTGRPSSYRGSRFLLAPGTSRVLVKARRNDIESTADDNVTDATQIQVGWTARGLAVPR